MTKRGRRASPPGLVAAPSPRPPIARDPWAWAAVLSVVPLVLHSLGAPLGEPFADDFDYLYRALLARDGGFFDGYGSTLYWRPLGRQVYFGLLAPLILDHPRVVVAIHVLLLAAAALLLYRALRVHWAGPWAAVAASFPALAESTRMLIAWPSHFMDLGAVVLGALALHEAAHRRMATALLAVLGSLLSKEVGMLAALLVPWMPGGTMPRRERWRWLAAAALLVVAWGLAYLAICNHSGMTLPHRLEKDPQALATPAAQRLGWAIWNSARAMFSLAARPGPWDGWVGLSVAILVALGVARLATDATSRDRWRSARPWVVWGLAWFVLSSAPLIEVHPAWAPYRSTFGGIGLGIALAGLLGAADTRLLAPLLAVRLMAFALSPGPPRDVTVLPTDTGAAFDFARLVRLERLMADTRRTLKARFPTLPRGARVGQVYMPWVAEYAFAGSKALQVWYRDSTLRWVRFSEFQRNPDMDLTVIVDYESQPPAHVALIEPDAMRHCLVALRHQQTRQWQASLAEYDQADSIVGEVDAPEFKATVAGSRAVSLAAMDRDADAEREALRSLALWPDSPDAHYALGFVYYRRNQFSEARRELERTLAVQPQKPGALALLRLIDERTGRR